MATNQQNNKQAVDIDCTVNISIGGKSVTASGVINEIRGSNVKKYEIDYGDDVRYSCDSINGVVQKRFDTQDKISAQIEKSGVLAGSNAITCGYEEDKLLYVGKSKNIPQRLKDHLIQCNAKTYSHIDDVYNYLLDRKNKGLPLKLKYCAVAVSDPKHNATVEGYIIDYILNSNSDRFFSDCRNRRED